MFSLEISFQDGVSQPEMIFVRRPQALVGSSEYAHVVIEDMKNLNYQLRLTRDLGRKFRCTPVGVKEGVSVPQMLQGVYEGDVSFDLGAVKLVVTALDIDLLLKDSEPPDRAGVRIVRQACSRQAPVFPAIMVPGNDPMVASFSPDQPIYIGRSNQCAVRLDASSISAKHARMGYESGEFWIEDLGSTNGTFVEGQQISGRISVTAGAPVVLGREITIIGVATDEQIQQARKTSPNEVTGLPEQAERYPILVSASEVVRPARLVVPLGATLNIGRDPSSDMWLGAPHISRQHCVVNLGKTGDLSVTDQSTNGTAYDGGILGKGESFSVQDQPRVLNFGGGVTVGICFSEEEEQNFLASQGAPHTFATPEELVRIEQERKQSRRADSSRFPQTYSPSGTETFAGHVLHEGRSVYRRLSFRSKLFLVFTLFLLGVMALVIIDLLKPLFL